VYTYDTWARPERIGGRLRSAAVPALTVDAMIMAGLADTRGEAIRRALDRIRQLPAYERLRALVADAGRLKDDFSAD
jgi:hypothetical protein